MSKSMGLERHTYEAMILDLELAKSLLMSAMTSRKPHPLPHCHRNELTCSSFPRRSCPRMIKEDQEEQGEGHNQEEQQKPIRVLENYNYTGEKQQREYSTLLGSCSPTSRCDVASPSAQGRVQSPTWRRAQNEPKHHLLLFLSDLK